MELSGRRDDLAAWQEAERPGVLAVQIQAGGLGVDLTRARYSIFYSLSFSLGEYQQALARIHRPGQTRPVAHIHLVARETVDEKIMGALERRAEVVTFVLDELRGVNGRKPLEGVRGHVAPQGGPGSGTGIHQEAAG
jgi:SNF2 family DNA or RNA helicase